MTFRELVEYYQNHPEALNDREQAGLEAIMNKTVGQIPATPNSPPLAPVDAFEAMRLRVLAKAKRGELTKLRMSP